MDLLFPDKQQKWLVLTKNIFAEPAQDPLFTTLITGYMKYFLTFPKSHSLQNLLAK